MFSYFEPLFYMIVLIFSGFLFIFSSIKISSTSSQKDKKQQK